MQNAFQIFCEFINNQRSQFSKKKKTSFFIVSIDIAKKKEMCGSRVLCVCVCYFLFCFHFGLYKIAECKNWNKSEFFFFIENSHLFNKIYSVFYIINHSNSYPGSEKIYILFSNRFNLTFVFFLLIIHFLLFPDRAFPIWMYVCVFACVFV